MVLVKRFSCAGWRVPLGASSSTIQRRTNKPPKVGQQMDGQWEVFETPDVEDGAPAAAAPVSSSSADVDDSQAPEPERVFEVFAGKRFVVGAARAEGSADGGVGGVGGDGGRDGVRAVGETPLQRFNRLRMEVDDLARDLQGDGDVGEEQAPGPAHSDAYEALSTGVKSLQATLSALERDDALVAAGPTTAAKSQELAAINKARSDALREKLESVRAEAPAQGEGAGGVSVDLYFSPQHSSQLEEAHASDVEKRVAALEALVGASGDASAAPGRPLAEAVGRLEQQLGMLDEGRLSIIAQRIKSLGSDLDEGNRQRQRRSSAVSAAAAKDTDALLDKLDRCDAVASTLPALVERLKTVQEIHQHNANFHSRLDDIDRLQDQLDAACNLDRELLENLKVGMKDVVAAVDARLA